MKHFMIKYRFADGIGSREAWHQEVARFVAALDSDPAVKGRIAYRVMTAKNESGEYYHLAGAADDAAIKALQSQEFFTRYNAETRRVGGGVVEVVPLEIVAETAFRA